MVFPMEELGLGFSFQNNNTDIFKVYKKEISVWQSPWLNDDDVRCLL